MPLSIIHLATLSFLLYSHSFLQAKADLNADKLALVALKSRFIISSNSSFNIGDWSSNISVCNWTGVTCGSLHRRVVALDIPNMNVGGTIPPELGNLTFLVTLNLAGNSFRGDLPQELARLRRLKILDLSSNSFQGELPDDWLRNMTRLQFLYLAANNFGGRIPSSIFNMSTLENISLRNNNLYGRLPLDICVNGLHNLVELELSNNMIGGEIPSTLSYCSQLQTLTLSYNNFIGEIPKGIANMTWLSGLGLKVNNLSGSIPAEIGRLHNLWFLALQWNNLSGPIPAEIGELHSLMSLAMHENKLSGPMPPTIGNLSSLLFLFMGFNNLTGKIPQSICNLSLLKHLNLEGNKMEGNIPQCIVHFSVDLQILILQGNHFNGSIPDTFKENNTLLYLDLNSNRLQGTLPKSLLNCVRLQVLNVGNNEIRDMFPFWIGSLPELRCFVINSNRLYGDVLPPLSKTAFQKLRILDISHNGFSGSIPDEFLTNFLGMKTKMNWTEDKDWFMFSYQSMAQVIKGVERIVNGKVMILLYTIINLSNNEFGGSIPDSIGELVSLNYLYLSQNRFTGPIPKSLANLSKLEALDLSSNQLVGQIPRELTRLTSLSMLNLSWNNLTGPIPTGAQFGTFDYKSYMGNSGLCGHPFVSKKCQEVRIQPSPPIQWEEDEHGFFDGFTWRAVLIGYGVGIIVGVELVYLILLWGRPAWFVNFYHKVECCFEAYFGLKY